MKTALVLLLVLGAAPVVQARPATAQQSATADKPATAASQATTANQFVLATMSLAERQQIDDAANAVIKDTGLPSAQIAVVLQGRTQMTAAYGLARLDPAVKATPEMRYSIGSISKQFTAAAVLMLQEQGKLSLDDKVSKFLPDLTRANEVTIRELLAHTSGYQDFWPEDYVMTTMMQPATAQHILDVWGKKPLDFEPGTQWQYSNTNYVIAGRIVEMVSGEPLFRMLEQRVFGPLGMKSAFDQDKQRLKRTDALGYYQHALGPLRPAPEEGFGWMFAAGELAMTAGDLAKWDIAMMNEDPRILSAKSWQELETEVKLKNGDGTHYGLGVQVVMVRGHRLIAHSGEVSGFVAQNYVFPDDKAAIVVLTNEDASSGAAMIARKIAGIVMPAPAPAAATSAAGPAAPAAPAASASAAKPSEKPSEPPMNEAAMAQAKMIFAGLQQGKIDRALLTDLTNAYFTQEALDDFKSSLAPLGAPVTFVERTSELRGGMTFHYYKATFANGKSVGVTTYIEPDGKIEQYLVFPVQ